MNNVSILAIVNCAFRICFFYLLKCLVPPIKLGSYISLCSSQDYDKQMNKSICKLKSILSEVTFTYENCSNDVNDTVYSLKIKDIGCGEPKKGNYVCSEIYINKADRTFNVMTEEGFKTFALRPKSIVRSERCQ